MKKLLSLALCAALAVSLLAGCSSNVQKGPDPTPAPATAIPTPDAPTAPATGVLKTGLAIVSEAEESDSPEDGKGGEAEMNSAVVAVLVDENGVITDCVIDAVQTKIGFSIEGKVTTPLDTKVQTKNELGAAYGMKRASAIGKEWNEQAAALAEYAIGKTVADLKGIALDGDGHATDAELASVATYDIGEYLTVIEKAVNNAQALGAQAGDKLGVGIDTNVAKSKDAGEKDGLAQAYSIYAAASFDASGKITSCILDGTQTNVNFNTKGVITNDIDVPTMTKNELKEAYGMKGASGIGKEWYEQAAAFAAYVTGKTMADVKGIAVDDTGHATGADLTSSVTISVGAFQSCLERAANTAK